MTDEQATAILSRLPYGRHCQIETHKMKDGKTAQWMVVYGESAVKDVLRDMEKQVEREPETVRHSGPCKYYECPNCHVPFPKFTVVYSKSKEKFHAMYCPFCGQKSTKENINED